MIDMAGRKEGIQPAQPSPHKRPAVSTIVLIAVFIAMIGVAYEKGYFDFGSFIHSGGYTFVGKWATTSPATFYLKDVDGERYGKITANFQLGIAYDGQYYIGSSTMSSISAQRIGDSGLAIVDVENPLSFDARNYGNLPLPYSGISQVQISGNTMTAVTPLSGGSEKIVFNLVSADANSGGKDTLYATASVVATPNGQSMGEESGPDAIVLVRQ